MKIWIKNKVIKEGCWKGKYRVALRVEGKLHNRPPVIKNCCCQGYTIVASIRLSYGLLSLFLSHSLPLSPSPITLLPPPSSSWPSTHQSVWAVVWRARGTSGSRPSSDVSTGTASPTERSNRHSSLKRCVCVRAWLTQLLESFQKLLEVYDQMKETFLSTCTGCYHNKSL